VLSRSARVASALTLSAIALTASGCNARQGAQAASPQPSPSAAVDVATSDTVVYAATIEAVADAVASGDLPAADRSAFAHFVANNRNRPEAYDGKTVRQIVNFEIAYENGVASIANSDRREEANARALERVIDARVVSGRDLDRAIVFGISIRNKSSKSIKHVDLELTVRDAAAHKTVGRLVLNIDRLVPPHATATFPFPVRYAVFGGDAGSMIAAARRAKTYDVRPSAILFADGSRAGDESD